MTPQGACAEADALRKADCGDAEIDICDPTTSMARTRLSQIVITHDFIQSLFDLSPLKSHPITPTLRSLFSPSSYLHVPSAEELHRRVRALWSLHNGNECAAHTFNEFKHVLNLEEMHSERMRLEGAGKEYKQFEGKPFETYLASTLAERSDESDESQEGEGEA